MLNNSQFVLIFKMTFIAFDGTLQYLEWCLTIHYINVFQNFKYQLQNLKITIIATIIR